MRRPIVGRTVGRMRLIWRVIAEITPMRRPHAADYAPTLIFALQWLHSAYSYTLTQCVPVYEYSHALVSAHSQHI